MRRINGRCAWRPWWGAVVAAVLSVTVEPLHADDPGSASAEDEQLLLAVHDGRLSVQTGAVPLATVLQAIENATDLRVTIKGDLGDVRPQAFDDLTLEEGLRRLIGDRHPLVMVYGPLPNASGTGTLEEVRVYGEAERVVLREPARSPVRAASPPARPHQADAGSPADIYLYGSDSAGRKEAARQLAEGSDDAVQVLRGALDDPESEVRLRALRALQTLQGDQTLEHVSKVVRLDPDPKLRQAAVYMLGGVAAGAARRVLQAALADPDERVRQAAEQTLSQLRAR